MKGIRKYRKKPVEVEAIQWTWENWDEIRSFIPKSKRILMPGGDKPTLVIRTLEGDIIANYGDYIIKGIKGEYYPCKPEIFSLTYELVGE